ncbi:MAG: metalloregulator ArsR/SmtB family transcription factor [Pseudotabrizicola sp.]|uniref:ArsR/SmtB family transcription factor n=1 Tax=Pseudotabrizicola sp. TaxID=2939647 RepID=UPI0027189A06|nr:metalloregulator ArsR/SmtB family transcription factor [Pseudotabrizicola sp.]MDO8883613.1 metalloregulator ArsR/SmtB family transcription factor [Pseudotabrizicola sp.]MDP2081266.1 metalloregulator ArsR/SmtB family transcription factor [Pseudotabrizicola sp.]MDZ7576115.1 metalloregulator ArsR/SmtB family transcription factor [Pseudotabrizicola sp.]
MPLGEMDQSDQNAPLDLEGLVSNANDAATFLKALGHDGRLLILCHLQSGPKSVTELENLLSARQAVVSQQLARLRLEGLVSARREGQAIFYSILDSRVSDVIGVLAKLFCKPA